MKRLAPGEAGEKLKREIPLRRFGESSEIGMAAVFLASNAANYITGETLVVDGGHWLAKPSMIPRTVVEQMMAKAKS